MALRLVQIEADGVHGVALLVDAERVEPLADAPSLYALASDALADGFTLAQAVEQRRTGRHVPLETVRLLAPIEHPDPAHLYLTGTGLTHLGSAESRDKMHALAATEAGQTDSMRIFREGLEGGKPAPGMPGVQPEWFYKGDGSSVVPYGAPLQSPAFALDGGEEPEIAGIYLIDADGVPRRLGFTLANEFSDHITERHNYLWLAHSKLRPAALGAELLAGALPPDVRGMSRIYRQERVLWEKPFLTGEANMSHAIANLEHHHFKYAQFRRPGDVHVHFFGTATLSFTDQVRVEPGDVFDIRADAFLLPLRNPLARCAPSSVAPRPL